jgi:hypothetical protein
MWSIFARSNRVDAHKRRKNAQIEVASHDNKTQQFMKNVKRSGLWSSASETFAFFSTDDDARAITTAPSRNEEEKSA